MKQCMCQKRTAGTGLPYIALEKFYEKTNFYHLIPKTIMKTFITWKPIRDEVFALMREGKNIEAANITKGKGVLQRFGVDVSYAF